ncbi:SAM-dependent methyltransferase [Achromatium sp. WMS1]|nr:SAM-dependent methyltransferase [Achromatium sp. WMS1]
MNTPDSLHTILDYIRWGASSFNKAGLFFGHGTDNAIDESITLVLHALHLPLDLDANYFASRITTEEQETIVKLLQHRIIKRQPAAYLTQRAWFAGLEFYVDQRVLVPRSPIAELITEGFAPWLDASNIHRVLDIGTGSGCIGIAIAMHFPNTNVDLIDISEDALAVARHNVAAFNLEERVQIYHSDLFQKLPTQRYDLIIANPPYVSTTELATLPVEYQREPCLGLAGGDDGLEIVRRILHEAATYLEPDGMLVVEVGTNTTALEQAYPQLPFLWLEFARGGTGVFMLSAKQLQDVQNIL